LTIDWSPGNELPNTTDQTKAAEEGTEAVPITSNAFPSYQFETLGLTDHSLSSNHQGDTKISRVLDFAAMRHAPCEP